MENIIWIQNYQSPCGELILGSLDGQTLFVRLDG